MSEEDKDETLDSTNETSEEDVKTDEAEDTSPAEGTEGEEQDDTAANELEEKNKKLYERAKKAEAELKELKARSQEKKEVPQDTLPAKDVIALAKSDVHDDDVQEVLDFAKFKNISVSEALKSSYIQAKIKESEEERKSAEASNTSGSKRSSGKLTDEMVYANAEKGIEPKNDEQWQQMLRHRRKISK